MIARTARRLQSKTAGVMLDIIGSRLKNGQLSLITTWDDKVRVYGDRFSPTCASVTLTDPAVVLRTIINVSTAVGYGYMDGKVQTSSEEGLFDLFELIAKNPPRTHLRQPYLRASNRQRRQINNIGQHYDQGNEYYSLFLGETMLYSCGYDPTGTGTLSLDDMQRAKVNHLVAKLDLDDMPDGGRILDVGCGWGYLAVAIAKRVPNARVVGITISRQQWEFACGLAERERVADRVEFRLQGYQDVPEDEPFDRIISVGMFEHVGKRYYRQFFAKMRRLLVDDGTFVLHTITQQAPGRKVDKWTDREIFPAGNLPTKGQIADASESSGWYSKDWEDLAEHYARTLYLWWKNHSSNKDQIIRMGDKFGERFYRKRTLWLIASWAGFAHGKLGLTQVVLKKGKDATPRTRDRLYRIVRSWW